MLWFNFNGGYIFREWVGKAIAAFLLWLVSKMIWARKYEVGKQTKFVVCNNNDQTAVDSIVAAQHGINTIYNILQSVNVSLLKIRSIWLANAPKV